MHINITDFLYTDSKCESLLESSTREKSKLTYNGYFLLSLCFFFVLFLFFLIQCNFKNYISVLFCMFHTDTTFQDQFVSKFIYLCSFKARQCFEGSL